MKEPIILQKWAVVYIPQDAYTPPELWIPRLDGFAENHPRFTKGHPITTSAIIGKKGEFILTQSGSLYSLGEVEPKYEAQFPNAKERLFNSLEEK